MKIGMHSKKTMRTSQFEIMLPPENNCPNPISSLGVISTDYTLCGMRTYSLYMPLNSDCARIIKAWTNLRKLLHGSILSFKVIWKVHKSIRWLLQFHHHQHGDITWQEGSWHQWQFLKFSLPLHWMCRHLKKIMAYSHWHEFCTIMW